MNKHMLVAALALAGAAAKMPTHGVVTEHKYHLDRLNPRLKGTPPNPNRKTKAEKKRDRKEKQRASAAERQAREEPPVASARRTET
jgi:hypothetical protein